jgi:hypothetical protein
LFPVYIIGAALLLQQLGVIVTFPVHVGGLEGGGTAAALAAVAAASSSSSSSSIMGTLVPSPPSLQDLPSSCPSPAAVAQTIAIAYPRAHFNPAYQIGPESCSAAPTIIMPDGEQVAVVIDNDTIVSTVGLRPITSSASNGLLGSFSRWSGYEAYSSAWGNRVIGDISNLMLNFVPSRGDLVEVASQREVPAFSVPPGFEGNSTLLSKCCAFSVWTGQTDSDGGIADGKLVQIGIESAVSNLQSLLGYEYTGFYQALPSTAVEFNGTQVPCGMPTSGQQFLSAVIDQGPHNSTSSSYALLFENPGCASGYYVVYLDYGMQGMYGEFQSEAPVVCAMGLTQDQIAPPRFTGDVTFLAAFSVDAHSKGVTWFNLGDTTMNGDTINLNAGQESVNTSPNRATGGFDTSWVSSELNPGPTEFC